MITQFHVLIITAVLASQVWAVKQASVGFNTAQADNTQVLVLTRSSTRTVVGQTSQVGLVFSGRETEITPFFASQATGAPTPGTTFTLDEATDANDDALATEGSPTVDVKANATGVVSGMQCNTTGLVAGPKPNDCATLGTTPHNGACTMRCHTIAGTSCPSAAQIETSGSDYSILSESGSSTGSVMAGNTRCCYVKLYDAYCNDDAFPDKVCNGNDHHYEQINTTCIKGVKATGSMMSLTCTVVDNGNC